MLFVGAAGFQPSAVWRHLLLLRVRLMVNLPELCLLVSRLVDTRMMANRTAYLPIVSLSRTTWANLAGGGIHLVLPS